MDGLPRESGPTTSLRSGRRVFKFAVELKSGWPGASQQNGARSGDRRGEKKKRGKEITRNVVAERGEVGNKAFLPWREKRGSAQELNWEFEVWREIFDAQVYRDRDNGGGGGRGGFRADGFSFSWFGESWREKMQNVTGRIFLFFFLLRQREAIKGRKKKKEKKF